MGNFGHIGSSGLTHGRDGIDGRNALGEECIGCLWNEQQDY
jgi:hypothetical protein